MALKDTRQDLRPFDAQIDAAALNGRDGGLLHLGLPSQLALRQPLQFPDNPD